MIRGGAGEGGRAPKLLAVSIAVIMAANLTTLLARGGPSASSPPAGAVDRVAPAELESEPAARKRRPKAKPASPDARPSVSKGVTTSSNPRLRLPFTLSIAPACGSRGDTMIATIKTVEDARVSLMVVYADGNPRETWYVGPVSPDGRLTFPWVIPADAPMDDGTVIAVGSDQKRSARAQASFTVAERGACR